MESVIAVWGKNGAGKSTVAVAIGTELAKNDWLVGIIVADTAYASAQHLLGIEIPQGRGLGGALKNPYDEAAKYFVESPRTRNLFLLALSEKDNCFTVNGVGEDEAKRLLLTTKERFDCIIVDCTASIKDSMTFIGLSYSTMIIDILQANITDYKFRLSHQPFLDEFRLREKVVYVINGDRGYFDIRLAEKGLKTKFSYILPYSETVFEAENNGEILSPDNIRSKKDKQYLKTINSLVSEVMG